MNKPGITLLTLCLVFLAIGGTSISIPAQSKRDPFEAIPEGRRERLKYRLAEFIEYQRKKQWDKVFDMLAEQYKKSGTSVLTKEEFIKKRLYNRVSKFTPAGAIKLPEGFDGFIIDGCGRFGFEDNYEAAVEAYYENGEWFFSTITVVTCIDCPPKDCWHKKPK